MSQLPPAPLGYSEVSVPLSENSTKEIMLWMCNRCGALVLGTIDHDRFHSDMDVLVGKTINLRIGGM